VESGIALMNNKPLYFDYQGSTPIDRKVFDAMLPYYEAEFGNPHSGEHLHGQSAFAAIEIARSEIANCIGADDDDVLFTSGASEANNLAILGTARSHTGRRTKILVSKIEHSSVLEAASASGLEVMYIPVDCDGQVDLGWLASALSDRVLLVSVGFVNNEIGTIQDITQIASLVQSSGALFHVDAAQAITSVPICMSDYGVDFMSLSSHKAYGPKGIGALYIAPGRRTRLQPLIFGGGQEHGLRAGTLPTPLCVGFGAACSMLREIGEAERRAVGALRDYFFSRLRSLIPGIELVGHRHQRHPGNLSLRLPIDDARNLIQLLQPKLSCSTGSACHSGTDSPSHVLTNIGLSVCDARRVVRLSLGRFTSQEECDSATRLIQSAVFEMQKLDLTPSLAANERR
jgi:cysteine desulfurase